MGVVNVTPDSFSDGGSWFSAGSAIEHGRELAAQGADIVDVGGESTRPGAQRVSEAEELRRVVPVVTGLARAGILVSIDTMRAAVAERALEAGARMVNDVSGGLADPPMAELVARAGVPYVVVHWRGHSQDMYRPAIYADVVGEVRAELGQRLRTVLAAGIDPAQVIVDPGLGFAKLAEHNWELLTRLAEVGRLDGFGQSFPVLVGASRKRFIGRLLAAADGEPRPFARSDDATVALTALAAEAGAWCVRVHSVPGSADAVRVAARWQRQVAADRQGTAEPGAAADRQGTAEPGAAADRQGTAERGAAAEPATGAQPEAGRQDAGLDRISLLGLRGFGRHGVLPSERAAGQEFVLDAVLWADTRAAAMADDLSLTVDYGALADQLAAIVAGPPVALIETLAERLAAACLDHPAVREAEITVHKPQAPVAQPVSDVAVTIRRSRPPAASRTVVLALGSNLGDRLANLQRGLDELCGPGLACTAISPVYETDPVGGPEQGDYLNAVLLASSALPAGAILARCQSAEAALGRVRTQRRGPRTLDVDIIACGDEISDDPALTLPHPRAHERAFVLAPWLDLAPDARLPGRGPVAGLLAATATGGIRRLAENLALPGSAAPAVPR